MKYTWIALIALLVFGCKEDSAEPERKNLKLNALQQSLVLDETKLDEPALAFEWTEATPIGADYTFTYIFRMDIADNKFETAIDPITVADGVNTVSFTHGELYDLIVEKWGQVAGQNVQVEARIVAKVNGPKFVYPEIATTKIFVETYVPLSQPLYILGSATTVGLDASGALRMMELSNGRVYSWSGEMKVGNYKFITTLGSMLPSYNRGDGANQLVERTLESEPDTYFTITQNGLYYIYLSMKTMTVTSSLLKYQNIYLVGDATTAGWDLSRNPKMVPDVTTPSIFTITTSLKAGEMKILTDLKWEAPTFRPFVADGLISETDCQLTTSGPDHKWKVTEAQAGTYKITLDTEKNKITFVKM